MKGSVVVNLSDLLNVTYDGLVTPADSRGAWGMSGDGGGV